jgi:hypothetical protein
LYYVFNLQRQCNKIQKVMKRTKHPCTVIINFLISFLSISKSVITVIVGRAFKALHFLILKHDHIFAWLYNILLSGLHHFSVARDQVVGRVSCYAKFCNITTCDVGNCVPVTVCRLWHVSLGEIYRMTVSPSDVTAE